MNPEHRKTGKRAEALLWSILGVVVSGLALGGWAARDYIEERLASKEDVIVAGTKADFSLDKHMEYLLERINQLERKRNKTVDDRDQLKFLRDELNRLRAIRRGKS